MERLWVLLMKVLIRVLVKLPVMLFDDGCLSRSRCAELTWPPDATRKP